MKNNAVVVKLVTGDLLIGTLQSQTSDKYTVSDIISIKTVYGSAEGGVTEKTVTSSFCSLTDSKVFTFRADHVLFVSPLSTELLKFYHGIIEAQAKADLEEPEDFYVPPGRTLH